MIQNVILELRVILLGENGAKVMVLACFREMHRWNIVQIHLVRLHRDPIEHVRMLAMNTRDSRF